MTPVKTTSAVAIIALFELIRDHGMPLDELEKKTGIDCSKMADPDARISMSQFLKLWEIAISLTKDPALGLHLRKNYGRNIMHFVVNLALNSTTLLEALNHWIHYEKLICESDRIEVREEDGHYIISYTNTSPEHENRWIPEHHMSLAFDYAQQITGQKSFLVEVRFRHCDPGYADEYNRVFRCPVLFEQNENAVVIRKEEILRPILSRDPYLQAILKKHADKALEIFSTTDSVQHMVQQYIMKHLPLGAVNIESVSKSLNMDRSTLHRHLKKEGTSFKSILTDTRKTLSQNYLSQGLTIIQITYLLGFSDPSTFQRAFKRWFSKTPGEFRKNENI